MRHYAELTERINRSGDPLLETRWIAFDSKDDWTTALKRHADPSAVVSIVFHGSKPVNIEAELFW